MSRGCVTRKRDLWYAVVSVTDPKTGQRRRDWGRGFRTRREAHARLTQVLARLDAGAYVGPTRQTVSGFLKETWLPAKRTDLKPGTLAMYETCIEAYLPPRIGSLRLPELSPSHLNGLYGDLLERGGRMGRGLADKTVRNVHTIIHRALTDAVRWGLLARNVADAADPPRKRSREMRTWTREQLRSFLDHARDDRLFPAFLLAATTGMRRGEVLGLRWGDVDLDAGRIAVRRSLVVVKSRLEFSDTKSGRGRRVALDPTTKAVLRLHRKHQAEERLAWGPAYRDDDLVICREDGTPLNPDRLVDAFERHKKAAGLPRIRFHDLRHTHATLALAAGVHPKVVSERLGHASIAITMDTYSHAIPTLDEDAARMVASLVFGE